jgi:hypothetical protein
MIGSWVHLGTRLRPPQVGASQAGPECAMPQIRSLAASVEAPIRAVSKGTDGLSRRSSSAVRGRLWSNRRRSTPSLGTPVVGRCDAGVSSRRNRVGRPSSEVSEAWNATASASDSASRDTVRGLSAGQ